ncbi:MAG: hypothetical protein ACTHMS_14105 [Jatrophihabitans sp.]|uniref:hypothetical protein n=1 Tax=Jatrophihabitans sp. TaxID=1932789 RepID=UPI003F809EB7
MTLRPPDETFVRTDHDLFDLWRDLMGTEGFGTRSLWHVFLGPDGRLEPVVVPIDDLPATPDTEVLATFAGILHDLRDEVGWASMAVLLSRPGPGTMSAGDRAWARAVGVAYARLGPRWPMHLATRGHVRLFAPDDLIAV